MCLRCVFGSLLAQPMETNFPNRIHSNAIAYTATVLCELLYIKHEKRKHDIIWYVISYQETWELNRTSKKWWLEPHSFIESVSTVLASFHPVDAFNWNAWVWALFSWRFHNDVQKSLWRYVDGFFFVLEVRTFIICVGSEMKSDRSICTLLGKTLSTLSTNLEAFPFNWKYI